MRTLKTALTLVWSAALLSLASFPATAQSDPATTLKIANYKGAGRQAVLEAGAKKEGELQLYAVGTQIDPLVEKFHSKYPYIRVTMFRGTPPVIARKVIEETRAGRHIVDGYELAASGFIPINETGGLIPFYSPEAQAFPDEAFGPNRHWLVVRESYVGIGINTKQITPADAPKSYDDLLDPRWKGKMAISNEGSTPSNWVGAMLLIKNEQFIRQLGKQDFTVYSFAGGALSNMLASGEIALSPTIYNSHVSNHVEKGAALKWISPGTVPVLDSGVAISKYAPHPHAMMMMADFLLSKEIQIAYQGLGYASPRTDVTNPDSPGKKLYLANRPNYLAEYESWDKLKNEVFKKNR